MNIINSTALISQRLRKSLYLRLIFQNNFLFNTLTSNMKVLILDNIEKSCGEFLAHNGFAVTEKPKLSKDELKSIIGEYDVLLVRSATKVTADILELGKKLKLIGRAGAGVDNIDIEASTRQGIIVMNTPGGNTISAAEHTCGMILSVARMIPQAHAETKRGIWDKKKWLGRELDGKTLAVIGLGKIGREVAMRMQAFGMKIIGYDPMLPSEVAAKSGIVLLPLEETLRQADFITIHTPLNEATRNLISAKTIALMKDGVRIVNCARGGIIHEADLAEALQSGKVAAAALDVFDVEPITPENPLLNCENAILTPHIAASTVEAQEKVARQIAEQVVEWKNTHKLIGAVNASVAELAQHSDVQTYLLLAKKLGDMQGKLLEGKPKLLRVTYSGDFLRKFGEAITAAVLTGYLSTFESGGINYINVFRKAQDMGLHVEQYREKENQNYTSLVRVDYETDQGKRTLSGIVLDNKDPRIVQVDSFDCEFKPEGTILIYTNDDKPGVLAQVVSALHHGNINIANVSLSRNEEKTLALTLVGIDGDLDDATLHQIAQVKGVYNPRLLKL
jgi:D-3-phosphoglycerate dehydrogenase